MMSHFAGVVDSKMISSQRAVTDEMTHVKRLDTDVTVGIVARIGAVIVTETGVVTVTETGAVTVTAAETEDVIKIAVHGSVQVEIGLPLSGTVAQSPHDTIRALLGTLKGK